MPTAVETIFDLSMPSKNRLKKKKRRRVARIRIASINSLPSPEKLQQATAQFAITFNAAGELCVEQGGLLVSASQFFDECKWNKIVPIINMDSHHGEYFGEKQHVQTLTKIITAANKAKVNVNFATSNTQTYLRVQNKVKNAARQGIFANITPPKMILVCEAEALAKMTATSKSKIARIAREGLLEAIAIRTRDAGTVTNSGRRLPTNQADVDDAIVFAREVLNVPQVSVLASPGDLF